MKASGIITLTTDFGLSDPYVAMMKGVILSINPGAQVVDVSHQVRAGSIIQAAGLIHETFPFYPKGTVHVAGSLKEAMTAPEQSILVCPYIEPSWIPALHRSATVITESGGMLSHAAVLCREYGVPAILSVRDASLRLKSGTALLIDGESGQIEIFD